MATGDQADIVGRLKAALPPTWFPNTTQGQTTNSPVIDGLLAGVASVWSWVYSFIQFARAQCRIATASGVFLDMIGQDFFSPTLRRRAGELDVAFRSRILLEMFRPRVTRAAVIQVLTDLTGRVPGVFEPAYPLDTGGWGFQAMTAGTNLEYGGGAVAGAGGYGSLALGFQFFVTAYRATGGGIPTVGGYYTGSGWDGGGYGVGALEYATLSMSLGQITDTDIDAAVASVLPVATIAWTRISN